MHKVIRYTDKEYEGYEVLFKGTERKCEEFFKELDNKYGYIYIDNVEIIDVSNYKERVSLLKAMEFVARQVNDECVFDYWLTLGVADGDIKYGDLSDATNDFDYAEYTDDETLSELMQVFLKLMEKACRSGGLYCDGVVSKGEK